MIPDTNDRIRLLVLDDDPVFCFVVKAILEQYGYAVDYIVHPDNLDTSLLSIYEYLVLDIVLPGTDGIQILNRLSHEHPKIKIIVATSVQQSVIDSIWLLSGKLNLRLQDVLRKPIATEALVTLLSTLPSPGHHIPEPFQLYPSTLNDVAHALEHDHFIVELQPLVELSSGKWSGCEALVRWQYSEDQLLYPSSFINIVEESDMAMAFTIKVAQLAVEFANSLQEAVKCDFHLSINVPAHVMSNPGFVDELFFLLKHYKFGPANLIIELTERDTLIQTPDFFSNISRLKLRDIQLSIDDFGTAYSSLERINTSFFDEFKIDRLFISKIHNQWRDQEIVASLLRLGKKIGLTSVAEGIEDAATYTWLRENGCTLGQGFHIAKPMKLEDFIAWVSDYRPPS